MQYVWYTMFKLFWDTRQAELLRVFQSVEMLRLVNSSSIKSAASLWSLGTSVPGLTIVSCASLLLLVMLSWRMDSRAQMVLNRLPDGRCLEGGCESQRMEVLRRCLRHDPEHALVSCIRIRVRSEYGRAGMLDCRPLVTCNFQL